MRAILGALLAILLATPGWAKLGDGVSQRERQSFEQRWQTHRTVVPFLYPPAAPPATRLRQQPAEPVAGQPQIASRYLRADPVRQEAVAAEEAAPIEPLRAAVQPVLTPPSQALGEIVALGAEDPRALAGPLPYDPFNATYEGLRERRTDCVLHHEYLERTVRDPVARRCGAADALGDTGLR